MGLTVLMQNYYGYTRTTHVPPLLATAILMSGPLARWKSLKWPAAQKSLPTPGVEDGETNKKGRNTFFDPTSNDVTMTSQKIECLESPKKYVYMIEQI